MADAWVWDMYRPARFVKNVRVLTFKDVNVEELATTRALVELPGELAGSSTGAAASRSAVHMLRVADGSATRVAAAPGSASCRTDRRRRWCGCGPRTRLGAYGEEVAAAHLVAEPG